MPASIGVLMIGSLYWDKQEHRQSWREERLGIGETAHVRVPIRYGRLSQTRGNTYTMVFSSGLERSQGKLGSAVIVPCRRTVRSPCHLIEEAEALWRAERPANSASGDISASWGSVAIVQNPDRPLSSRILRAWADRVARENSYGGLCHSEDEKSLVDTATGLLNISWPADAPDVYSALLATATDPTLTKGQYPSVEQIAGAWNTPKGREYRDYFDNNRKHEIRTFQDKDIAQRLDSGSA